MKSVRKIRAEKAHKFVLLLVGCSTREKPSMHWHEIGAQLDIVIMKPKTQFEIL